ncbi:hypothetical protein HK100_005738 [Physocladia obscura]|uniref:DUF4097 domain-containing protein n=1 Tax=Physocladia obscura TaxID=109957 RepID=A0AAD5XC44_9FUNG|nr:hypothetical protein HK100_005738 [Physocladia obscura]
MIRAEPEEQAVVITTGRETDNASSITSLKLTGRVDRLEATCDGGGSADITLTVTETENIDDITELETVVTYQLVSGTREMFLKSTVDAVRTEDDGGKLTVRVHLPPVGHLGFLDVGGFRMRVDIAVVVGSRSSSSSSVDVTILNETAGACEINPGGALAITSRELTLGNVDVKTKTGSIKSTAAPLLARSVVFASVSGLIDIASIDTTTNNSPTTTTSLVILESETASITATSVTADSLVCATTSGQIAIDAVAVARSLSCKAESGSISIMALRAAESLTLSTKTGVLFVGKGAHVSRKVALSTLTGQITADLEAFRALNVSSGSGNVALVVAPSEGAKSKVGTVSGTVDVLCRGFSGAVAGRSGNGGEVILEGVNLVDGEYKKTGYTQGWVGADVGGNSEGSFDIQTDSGRSLVKFID